MRHFSDYLAIPKSDQLKLNFLGGLLLEDKRLTRDNLELFGVKYGPITRRRLLILSIPEELRLIFLIQESSWLVFIGNVLILPFILDHKGLDGREFPWEHEINIVLRPRWRVVVRIPCHFFDLGLHRAFHLRIEILDLHLGTFTDFFLGVSVLEIAYLVPHLVEVLKFTEIFLRHELVFDVLDFC